MKEGEVVTIRLAEEDILTCIDICERGGMQLFGASLAQVVKWGLQAMCHEARTLGIAPRHDDPQAIATRMTMFKDHRNKRKVVYSKAKERIGTRVVEVARAPTLPSATMQPLTQAERERLNHLAHKRARVGTAWFTETQYAEDKATLDSLLARDV